MARFHGIIQIVYQEHELSDQGSYSPLLFVSPGKGANSSPSACRALHLGARTGRTNARYIEVKGVVQELLAAALTMFNNSAITDSQVSSSTQQFCSLDRTPKIKLFLNRDLAGFDN